MDLPPPPSEKTLQKKYTMKMLQNSVFTVKTPVIREGCVGPSRRYCVGSAARYGTASCGKTADRTRKNARPSLCQCCINVGDVGIALGQHWHSDGPAVAVCIAPHCACWSAVDTRCNQIQNVNSGLSSLGIVFPRSTQRGKCLREVMRRRRRRSLLVGDAKKCENKTVAVLV